MPVIHEVDDHEVNPLSGKRIDVDARRVRRIRPLCGDCLRRMAVTRIRGKYVARDDHDLCLPCWRARIDAGAATRLARRRRPL